MFLIAVIVLVSLIGGLVCSFSEAALYSVSRSRIETLRRLKFSGGESLARLRDNVEEPISAILIMNTLFMTLGAIWSGAMVEKYYGNAWMGLFSAAFTAAVLFLGEIAPKSMGVRFADIAAPRLAWPLRTLVWILWPFVKAAVAVTRLFGKSVRISHPTEDDLISMALLSQAGGKILPQETKWIRNILRLNDVKTRDIMTPYSSIHRVSGNLTLSAVKADAVHWRVSRVLVCKDDDPDAITGVVQRRTVFYALLRRRPETTMDELKQPVCFVREGMPANELIDFFIRNRTQLACVRGGARKLTGVVTLEDVLEDMIGAEIE